MLEASDCITLCETIIPSASPDMFFHLEDMEGKSRVDLD